MITVALTCYLLIGLCLWRHSKEAYAFYYPPLGQIVFVLVWPVSVFL